MATKKKALRKKPLLKRKLLRKQEKISLQNL